jgi:hypothetical protein
MQIPFELPGNPDYVRVLVEHNYDYDAAVQALVDKYKLELPRQTIDEIVNTINRNLYHILYLQNQLPPGTVQIDTSSEILRYLAANCRIEYVRAQQLLQEDHTPRRVLQQLLVSEHPELIPDVCKHLITLKVPNTTR